MRFRLVLPDSIIAKVLCIRQAIECVAPRCGHGDIGLGRLGSAVGADGEQNDDHPRRPDRGRFHRDRRGVGRLRGGGAAQRGPGDPGRSCSRPAARTRTAGSTSRSALARPLPTRRSTGATRPSPTPAPATAACSGRAARCWAARPRSTAWSISAARPRISTTGASSAMPAGRSTTSCPISSAPSTRRAAPTTSTAPAARSACPMCPTATRSARPSSMRAIDAGLSAQRRFQRREPGRRRLSPDDDAQRQALLDRGRLSAPGDAAAQPARHHRGADRKDPVRRAPRGRRHLSPRRRDPHGARGARGHPVRRRRQLAATAAAVRASGRGRASGRARHPGGARSAGRRAEPAGPLLGAAQAQMHAADHPQRRDAEQFEEAEGRPANTTCSATARWRWAPRRRRCSRAPGRSSPRPTSNARSRRSAPTGRRTGCTGGRGSR